MGNKISKKEKFGFLFMCVAMVAIMWGAGYLINGAEMKVLPNKGQVDAIVITDTRLTEEERLVNTEDEIKTACSALDVVRIKYGEVVITDVADDMFLTMTFDMKDGSTKVFQASETHIIWDGTAYEAKQRGHKMFLEVMENIFFPAYVETNGDK